FEIVRILLVKLAHRFFISDYPIARPYGPMTGLSNRARVGTIRCVVVDIERLDESSLALRASGHPHGLLDYCLAGTHFVGSWRRPDRMPPCHGDSPLRHSTVWILLCYGSENSPGLFIDERVQQRHAANEFRSHDRCARYGEIHCPGRTQIAWFGDSCGFGVESCESADQRGDERRDAKECPNGHVRASSRLTQAPLSCKSENNWFS